ncbi:hypothetical protein ACHABQ_02850 [Nesterenkonia aurantiaca]|uniref:hypothetical protein n=1 Tax=Nesterenkonia aurantiaca TaxID=1436010 RepID=UPI003EE6921C
MSKTHEFDDGTVVELDDDVEVEDFLDADADEGTDEHAALVEQAEAKVEEPSEVDEEPAGIEAGA